MLNTNNSIVRVAQVVRPAEGGIRRHVSLLASGLDSKRFVSAVYAPADFTLDTAAPNVILHPVAISARTNIAADLRLIYALSKQLRGKADLVHAHGLRAALIGVLAAKRAGVPSVFTAHNLVPPMSGLQRILFRAIGRSAKRILAVSQAVADTLTAAGLPNEKIQVVPNGVALAAFDPPDTTDIRAQYHIPNTAPLIVAIGRLSHEKGFDLLLAAFATVCNELPDAHLLIAGDGPELETLRALASEFNVACHFVGRVDNVVPILRAADVVAVPSRQEGQGIVALEAMASRKPVVAAQVGGLAETIVPDITGLFFPPENVSALAENLTMLLQAPARCREMGLQGRRRVEQLYTLERMINNIATVYDNIVRSQV